MKTPNPKFTKTLKCQVVTIFLVSIMATLSPVYAQGTTNVVAIEKPLLAAKSVEIAEADTGLNQVTSNNDGKQDPLTLLLPEMVMPQCGGLGGAAIAACILAVGYILIRGLIKLCNKLLPPPPTPPPPPPNPGTNTNHSASAMIQLNETQTGGSSFPGIVLYLGNPGDTNGGSWDSASTGVNLWNIYEYAKTNSAFNDPLGVPYTALMASTIMSTTNLATPVMWLRECSMTGWISSASILQVWYTNGTPIVTNFHWSDGGTDTNSYSFPLNLVSPDTVPKKFFRMSAE